MIDDDDLSEEEQRRIAARIMVGPKAKPPIVEVRRGGKPKNPDPATLRFIQFYDQFDGEDLWVEVEQMGSSGWFHLELYEERSAAIEAAEKYKRSGDTIIWIRRMD